MRTGFEERDEHKEDSEMDQRSQDMSLWFFAAGCLGIMLLGLVAYSDAQTNHAPVVSNVYAHQRPGTRLIDITYDVEDADGDLLEITVEASSDDGRNYDIIPESVMGDVGKNIEPGSGRRIVWDVGRDLPGTKGEDFKVRVIADDGAAGPAAPVITWEDDAEMILIPAGEFSMGDHHGVGADDENPVHTIYLDAFYMDKYEVTNAQYAKFLNEYGKNTDAAGHELLDIDDADCLIEKQENVYRPKAGYEDHPVIEINWFGAAAYAQFYNKRLPTEAEWEKAARGGLVSKRYTWGDEVEPDVANYDYVGSRTLTTADMLQYLEPVGAFPPNGYGLHDMAGNVWEWCADEYDPEYYSKSPKDNPKGPEDHIAFINDDFANVDATSLRIARGGSWSDYLPNNLRAACRDGRQADKSYISCGFRCAVFSISDF